MVVRFYTFIARTGKTHTTQLNINTYIIKKSVLVCGCVKKVKKGAFCRIIIFCNFH